MSGPPPLCCAFRHDHPVWVSPAGGEAVGLSLVPGQPSQRAEVSELQRLLERARMAPAAARARVDAICELGEAIVQHYSGPGSLVDTRPGFRAVLLTKFACFRREIDRTGGRLYDGSGDLSAATRRRFRAVARALLARLNI